MNATGVPAMHVRRLNLGDLAAALELSTLAGWNQTGQDWSMLLELAPAGCFGIELDGRLVSTTTLLCYGQRLAWIGMVLTKPEYRGHGFARRLLGHALECADAAGIETIKLDATDKGQHLYESVGFREEEPIERWSRASVSEARISKDCSRDKEYSLELDREAFGADRSIMLRKLAERSEVHPDSKGYLFVRPGRVAAYLGPCVAADLAAARALITKAIHESSVSWSWDLLPRNQNAVALASELGFTRQRVLTRMSRGKPLRGRDDMVYAIAGFELG